MHRMTHATRRNEICWIDGIENFSLSAPINRSDNTVRNKMAYSMLVSTSRRLPFRSLLPQYFVGRLHSLSDSLYGVPSPFSFGNFHERKILSLLEHPLPKPQETKPHFLGQSPSSSADIQMCSPEAMERPPIYLPQCQARKCCRVKFRNHCGSLRNRQIFKHGNPFEN